MADPLPVDAARLKAEFPDLTDEDLQAYVTVTARVLGDAVSRAKKMREVMEQGRRAQEKARSGAPLTAPSTEVLRKFSSRLKNEVPLIGVGGIMSGADAKEKIDAGATLVQIYTGLIYRGPALVAECAEALADD